MKTKEALETIVREKLSQLSKKDIESLRKVLEIVKKKKSMKKN